MKYHVIIKEQAYDDMQQAYDYYEEQLAGLGDDFILEVKTKVEYIVEYPLHFQKVEKDFRQTVIDKFPFILLYEILGQEIIIYAVFHTSQDPDKKSKRVK